LASQGRRIGGGAAKNINTGWLYGRAGPLLKGLARFWDSDSSTEGSEGTGDEDKTAGEKHDDF